ncbi:MAG: glycosyltransferase family 4 protein [Candidatus Cryptobacteroides sp.]
MGYTGLCCIFNYAPHYRMAVYRLMNRRLGASFFFGDRLRSGEIIQKLDYRELPGFRKELKTRFFGPIEYTSGWLAAAFDRNNKTFIITNSWYALNQWLFLIVCKLLGKKVYVWTHGMRSAVPSDNGSPFTLFLASLYRHFVAGYFLYGDRAKSNMEALGYNPVKLHVIYNSLDYEKALKLRKTIPDNPWPSVFGNDAPVLVFIGRLTPVKRLDMLLEASSRLSARGIQANVAFIGDGPEACRLKQMADGRSDVAFLGAMYDEEQIYKHLYHAALCVSPGNVGLTAIHCLSYGLPVVTHSDFDSQVPECEAIIPGVTGELFIKGDVEDLTVKIFSILAGGSDREKFRSNCHKIVDERYNPKYQVDVMERVIFSH